MVLAKVNWGGSCGCLYMPATAVGLFVPRNDAQMDEKSLCVSITMIKAMEESFAWSPQCLKGSKVFGKYERDMSAG